MIQIDPEPIALTANEQRVKELLDQGKDMFRIAFMLHMSFEAVRDMIFEIRKKEAIDRMANPKLSNDQRGAIYASHKRGATMQELAKQYDVSVQTISNICAKLKKAEAEIEAADMPAPANAAKDKVAAFNSAVDDMIAEMRSEKAEELSADAEPEKIPHFIWCALDDRCSAINLEIETREERIAELQEQVSRLEAMKRDIQGWMEVQEWQQSEH